MPETIDWPMGQSRGPAASSSIFFLPSLFSSFGLRSRVSYWVDMLWFGSLGYLQRLLDIGPPGVGYLRRLRRADLPDSLRRIPDSPPHPRSRSAQNPYRRFRRPPGSTLPVAKALGSGAVSGALLIALATGVAMKSQWPTLALYFYAPASGRRHRRPYPREGRSTSISSPSPQATD